MWEVLLILIFFSILLSGKMLKSFLFRSLNSRNLFLLFLLSSKKLQLFGGFLLEFSFSFLQVWKFNLRTFILHRRCFLKFLIVITRPWDGELECCSIPLSSRRWWLKAPRDLGKCCVYHVWRYSLLRCIGIILRSLA